jgi:hypothetical protein
MVRFSCSSLAMRSSFPRRILCGHLAEESAQVHGDLRSAYRPGFPAPDETESCAVPAEEGIGLDVHQGAAPREHAPENDYNQPRGIVVAVWLDLALLEQGELFAQEEVLGCECTARPGNEHQEMDEITRDRRLRRETACQCSKPGAGHERSALHVTRLPTGGRAKFLRTTPGADGNQDGPYVPLSHPFLERLIGTVRREYLDQTPYVNVSALESL